jgi:predicted O-methyltransferase YrrM
MNLDIALGNIPGAVADRLGAAAIAPLSDTVIQATEEHSPGTAEPWISRLVHTFILASGARTVLETGTFLGGTSIWIMDALIRLRGGTYIGIEIDEARRCATRDRLLPFSVYDYVRGYLRNEDVLHYLANTTDRFDLAWVDDNHEKPHVQRELELLYPKMNPGGIILGHDVWGTCDLQEVFRRFGGTSLDLPRLGAAGGLGIIQVPSNHNKNFYFRSEGTQKVLEHLLASGAQPIP